VQLALGVRAKRQIELEDVHGGSGQWREIDSAGGGLCFYTVPQSPSDFKPFRIRRELRRPC
jgi:hypothetical protein